MGLVGLMRSRFFSISNCQLSPMSCFPTNLHLSCQSICAFQVAHRVSGPSQSSQAVVWTFHSLKEMRWQSAILEVYPLFKSANWRLTEARWWWQALSSWVKGEQIGEEKTLIPQVTHLSNHTKRLLETKIPSSFPGSRWPSSAAWSCPTHRHQGLT